MEQITALCLLSMVTHYGVLAFGRELVTISPSSLCRKRQAYRSEQTFLQNSVARSRITSKATMQLTYHHPSHIVLLRSAVRRQFKCVIISEYPLVQEKCGAELRQTSAGIKCPINPPLWSLTCILIMAALTY
jgi:hypothetical protein